MYKLIMLLFFTSFFYSQESNAKLIYKCEKVWIGGRQHLDVNVVFMTGYEILENITENKESYVKTNKYAMILLDEEMIIVVLDDPIEDNSENRNQGSNVEMGDIKNSNYSFANEYRTNCRLEFTIRCLKDQGNSVVHGEILNKGKRVTIKPRI
tara:strand:- start:1235 stop:1693 length:459 start_codon:yes stop_codon:yes gene_type:complete